MTVTITIGPQNRHDNRGHMVSRTQLTTRKHTKFEPMVADKRGTGMTVHYLDTKPSCLTLRGFHKERLNSWPGKSCCRKSLTRVLCTKRNTMLNPLSGYSCTVPCAISITELLDSPHQKRPRTSAPSFDPSFTSPSAKQLPALLLMQGKVGLTA